MTRAGVIAAHLVVLPVAALLSAVLALMMPAHRAIDIQLHDTYFVVAHFHATVILAVSVLLATAVAYRYGAIKAPIIASWALLIIHLLSVATQQAARQGAAAEPGVMTTILPAHPGMAYLYIATFIGGFCAVILGIALSLWAGIRRGEPRWSA